MQRKKEKKDSKELARADDEERQYQNIEDKAKFKEGGVRRITGDNICKVVVD